MLGAKDGLEQRFPGPSEPAYIPDTIAAVATAPGQGGIGIVRVSGPLAANITRQMLGFLPRPRHATYGVFRGQGGEPLDEGIMVFYPAPDSFTAEDVAEFQGHGGPVVLDLLLNRCVNLGARIAEPGEFTQRAFLNSKIDLTQAEAIADLIASRSAKAALGAMRSLQGEFSSRVDDLVARVTQLRVLVEAAIDFPEEEIDFLEDEGVSDQVQDLAGRLSDLLDRTSGAVTLAEGATLVLAGKPNAGKSSLMNRLTEADTSIVTDMPGTTRDLVTSDQQLDGIPVRLVDTAGLRISNEVVEAEGVKRTIKALATADLALLMLDASLAEDQLEQQLESLTREVKQAVGPTTSLVLVMNKMDLVQAARAKIFHQGLRISCKTGEGVDELKQHLIQQLNLDEGFESGFTARSRHLQALQSALAAVKAGEAALLESGAGELLAEELRHAQDYLGQITGKVSADDLLGEIFSSFCIGK